MSAQLSGWLGSRGQSANPFGGFSPQSKHPQATLYRCTEFAAYTGWPWSSDKQLANSPSRAYAPPHDWYCCHFIMDSSRGGFGLPCSAAKEGRPQVSRRCPHCRKAFEPSSGKQRYCGRKCYRAVYEVVARKKIRKRKKAYRAENRDRIHKLQAAYYAANREALNKRHAAYYVANRGEILKRQAAFYVANRERIAKRDAARYAAKKLEKKRLAQTGPAR